MPILTPEGVASAAFMYPLLLPLQGEQIDEGQLHLQMNGATNT